MNLRAFINVCRHRAHFVAMGTGNRKTLQCTYHGWVYGLDGCLRGVPRQEEGGLPPFETLGLYPLSVDTCAGFIFVAIDPQESLEEFVGELPQTLERVGYEFPFAPENVDPGHEYVRMPTENTTYANWKVYIENTVECYHCPTTHTHSFSDVYKVDADVYQHHEYDRGIYHATWYQDVVAGRLGLVDREGPPEYQFYFLWPNMFFGGGKRSRSTAGFTRRMPHGVHETVTVGARYRLPGADGDGVDEELARELEEAGRLTGEEDREVVARVQTGLRSGMYEIGWTLPESERNMRHFYNLCWQALAPAFRA
jgi:phenylpropionate dioxygenase-like ring-hydroxylating dioxygenase large terminal subunit